MADMRCPKCGKIGVGPYCSRCGTKMDTFIAQEEPDEEMFRRVSEGLAGLIDDEEEEGGEIISDYFERHPRQEAEEVDDDDEDFYEDDDDYYEDDEDYYEDRSDSRGAVRNWFQRQSRRVADSAGDAVNNAGEAVDKGMHHVLRILCSILRFVCAGLMAGSAGFIGWFFLAGIRSLDDLRESYSSGGTAAGIYLATGLALTVFAALQVLWVLKLDRRRDDGGRTKIDRGHGIFAFLIFLAAVPLAGVAPILLPELTMLPQTVSEGLQLIFHTFREMGDMFFMINGMGLILCILRRLLGPLL